jgi:hypothetical protein
MALGRQFWQKTFAVTQMLTPPKCSTSWHCGLLGRDDEFAIRLRVHRAPQFLCSSTPTTVAELEVGRPGRWKPFLGWVAEVLETRKPDLTLTLTGSIQQQTQTWLIRLASMSLPYAFD